MARSTRSKKKVPAGLKPCPNGKGHIFKPNKKGTLNKDGTTKRKGKWGCPKRTKAQTKAAAKYRGARATSARRKRLPAHHMVRNVGKNGRVTFHRTASEQRRATSYSGKAKRAKKFAGKKTPEHKVRGAKRFSRTGSAKKRAAVKASKKYRNAHPVGCKNGKVKHNGRCVKSCHGRRRAPNGQCYPECADGSARSQKTNRCHKTGPKPKRKQYGHGIVGKQRVTRTSSARSAKSSRAKPRGGSVRPRRKYERMPSFSSASSTASSSSRAKPVRRTRAKPVHRTRAKAVSKSLASARRKLAAAKKVVKKLSPKNAKPAPKKKKKAKHTKMGYEVVKVGKSWRWGEVVPPGHRAGFSGPPDN